MGLLFCNHGSLLELFSSIIHKWKLHTCYKWGLIIGPKPKLIIHVISMPLSKYFYSCSSKRWYTVCIWFDCTCRRVCLTLKLHSGDLFCTFFPYFHGDNHKESLRLDHDSETKHYTNWTHSHSCESSHHLPSLSVCSQRGRVSRLGQTELFNVMKTTVGSELQEPRTT